MVSAAAVAAAVAVAVPVGLNLHLSPPSAKESNAAANASPSHLTESPDGSASTDKTASPSPSSAHPAITPVGSAHPVPANFQPASITFVSAQDAWVIGQAGTPGQCANKNPYICTSIARTDDGGQTWQGGPAPDTSGPSGGTGVGGIRFLNNSYGWAFGPELWATDNGGTTWSKVDTSGARVTDLETSKRPRLRAVGHRLPDRERRVLVRLRGRLHQLHADDGHRRQRRLDAGRPGHHRARRRRGGHVGRARAHRQQRLPAGTGRRALLRRHRRHLDAGRHLGLQARPGPGRRAAQRRPAGAGRLEPSSAIACNGTSAGSPPALYTSDSGGASWTQPPAASWSDIANLSDFGVTTSLAAAPNGTLALATSTGIYYLPAGGERWQPSSATGSGAPKGGFSYVGMTTDEQGVAVPADTSLHEVWMTSDGGASWAPATSITPGN